MRFFTLTLLCLLFLPITAQAQTETPIGKFIAVSGGVFVLDENEETSVENGDPVFMDDVVETESNARALIEFKDETELVLGSNTRLEMNTYVFDPADTDNNKGDFTIKGPFVWMSGLLPKDNKNVTIDTGFGSIGIRGTTVWGGSLDQKFGVFVFDGKVLFTTETGRVSIENGEGVFIKDQRTALNVKKWGDPKIAAAVDTVKFADNFSPTQNYARVILGEKPQEEPTQEEIPVEDEPVPDDLAPPENELAPPSNDEDADTEIQNEN